MRTVPPEHTLVAFEHPNPQVRDAADELDDLSEREFRWLLQWLVKVRSRKIDYRWFKPYATYGGVPLFRAEAGGCVAVVSIEDSGEEDVKVSLLFVGYRHASQDYHAGQSWDGLSERSLLDLIVSRCGMHFRPF